MNNLTEKDKKYKKLIHAHLVKALHYINLLEDEEEESLYLRILTKVLLMEKEYCSKKTKEAVTLTLEKDIKKYIKTVL